MKILWITKVDSPVLTGGTKVSWHYRNELTLNNDLICICRYKHDKILLSRTSFLFQIFKLRDKQYDLVIFDDHYSVLSFFFKKYLTVQFYHGNLPSLMFNSVNYFIKGCYLFPQYLFGFFFSKCIVFVNPYFKTYFSFLNPNSLVLFNPVIKKNSYKANGRNMKHVLLVGNVDYRKYGMFKKYLDTWGTGDFEYHVFGKIIDTKLAKELEKFDSVKLMGFTESIPYSNYGIHISFSSAENLPLSLFEALIENCICVYPRSDNYNFAELLKVVNFYDSFSEIQVILKNLKTTNYKNDDLEFIPTSYLSNIERLIDKLKVK